MLLLFSFFIFKICCCLSDMIFFLFVFCCCFGARHIPLHLFYVLLGKQIQVFVNAFQELFQLRYISGPLGKISLVIFALLRVQPIKISRHFALNQSSPHGHKDYQKQPFIIMDDTNKLLSIVTWDIAREVTCGSGLPSELYASQSYRFQYLWGKTLDWFIKSLF